jgi:hypothetical protein
VTSSWIVFSLSPLEMDQNCLNLCWAVAFFGRRLKRMFILRGKKSFLTFTMKYFWQQMLKNRSKLIR